MLILPSPTLTCTEFGKEMFIKAQLSYLISTSEPYVLKYESKHLSSSPIYLPCLNSTSSLLPKYAFITKTALFAKDPRRDAPYLTRRIFQFHFNFLVNVDDIIIEFQEKVYNIFLVWNEIESHASLQRLWQYICCLLGKIIQCCLNLFVEFHHYSKWSIIIVGSNNCHTRN